MTMRVVFLQDYGRYRIDSDNKKAFEEFKALDEVFIPRQLGRMLCSQEIAIPAFRKEKHPLYQKVLKEERKNKETEKKEEAENLKKLAANKRKRAVSKKAIKREMAVLKDESAITQKTEELENA